MKLKSILRYPWAIQRAHSLLAQRRGVETLSERPVVHLSLNTDALLIDGGRHLACLAQNVRTAGAMLQLCCPKSLLARIAHKRYGRKMLADPAVSWQPAPGDFGVASLVLHDHDGTPDADLASVRTNFLRLVVGRDPIEGALVLPYPMHPSTQPHAAPEALAKLREQRRNVRLFFAGNQQTKYANPVIESDYGLVSRPRALQAIRAHHGHRVIDNIDQAANEDAIVLSDPRLRPIASSDWLSMLARTHFFLCPPGVSQPICHHLIEAMSVGTIPLIEYGNRLQPKLQDGFNAICFRGEQGLLTAIAGIDAMSPTEINALRGNVIDYYERHLRSDLFLERLIKKQDSFNSRYLSLPFHNRNLHHPRAEKMSGLCQHSFWPRQADDLVDRGAIRRKKGVWAAPVSSRFLFGFRAQSRWARCLPKWSRMPYWRKRSGQSAADYACAADPEVHEPG